MAGRAVIVGGGYDALTVRRGESRTAQGRTHLEVALGGQVRVWWTETMSIDVFGPSSIEWTAEQNRVSTVFHQLTWADVEIRRGEHDVSLPAAWRAEAGRGAFRLRGIAGGPSELLHHAGKPVRLEWLGNPSQPIPPVIIYPGSSVRLDQPRHVRRDPLAPEGVDIGKAWPQVGGEETTASVWPWRSRTDTPEQVEQRERMRRTTRSIDEPFGTPNGRFDRIEVPDGAGGTSSINLETPGTETYAQVPVMPSTPPRFTILPGTTTSGAASGSAPAFAGGEPPVKPLAAGPRRIDHQPQEELGSGSRSRTVELMELSRRGGTTITPDGMGAMPFASERASGTTAVEPKSTSVAEPAVVAYNAAQWRGLQRQQLNGTGVLAAERGTGVEVRVLGGGRTKVFVSSGSPAPRWCFTPQADYLMQPGAVAVFEPDGRLKMSFGTLEEHEPQAGRPSFAQLPAQ